MNISLISDNRVKDNKAGYLNAVDYAIIDNDTDTISDEKISTLRDVADVMLKFHIAPGIFKDGKRNKDNFISIDYLCFDFDSGTLSEKIHKDCLLKHWNHLLIGSKNHLKDKGDGKGIIERFHLFIPLASKITEPEFYKYCISTYGERMKWNADPAAKDVTRYFYKHSSILYCVENENNIDTNWLLEKREKDKEISTKKNVLIRRMVEIKYSNKNGTVGTPIQIFQHTNAFKRLAAGEMASGGGRYALSNIIIGVALKCGLSGDEIESLFYQYGALDGKSLTAESVRKRINQWS